MNIQMITSSNSLHQLQKKVDTLSHNIANMNTAGFKRREATFQELLTQEYNHQPHPQKEMGRTTPNGIRLGFGAMIGQTTVDLGQGNPMQTDRPLDFMISGEKGWFRVQRTSTDENNQPFNEIVYTRNGSFHWQQDTENPGRVKLVTAQGDAVLDSNNLSILVEPNFTSFTISPDGVITIQYPDNTETYQLDIAEINRPDLMRGIGDSLFRLEGTEANLIANGVITPITLTENKEYSIQQGFLEMSNVNLSQELTELIVTQRLMQFQTKSITIADDMMGIANSIRG